MSEHGRTEGPVFLTLRMKPPWVFIDEIRRFVESFCACACPHDNREAQLALAVHELMQNAIPAAQGDDVELRLEVDPGADRVAVGVTHKVEPADYDALADRIARMNREPDALQHYLRAMAESPTNSRGGLGLARVRYESQLELSVSRVANRMTVHAAGPLRVPALQAVGEVRR